MDAGAPRELSTVLPDPAAPPVPGRAPAFAAAVAAAMLGVYWAGGALGFKAGAFAWPFWPANGVVFAVLVRRPRREWPLLSLTQIAGELAGGALVGIPLHWGTVGYAVVDAGESLLAAALLRRWCGVHFDLRTLRRVALMLAACTCAVAAAAGVATGFAMLRGTHRGLRFFGTYAVGDLLGFAVVAPAVLRVLEPGTGRRLRARLRVEGLALAALLVCVTLGGFLVAWPAGSYALVHAVVPVLAWCALRLGTLGASLGVLVVATVGTLLTPHGLGPFAALAADSPVAFAAMQLFLAIVAATALLFAAAVAERRTAAAALEQAARTEAASTLASAVAHDFGNYLTVILGGAREAAAVVGPDHEAREVLAEIEQAGGSAHRLARKLMALGRGGPTVEEVVDLGAVARGVERLARHVAGPEVRFSLTIAAEPLPVLADRVDLERVLFNLVSNARAASRPGGVVAVEVQPCAMAPGGGVPVPGVLLRVRDEGSGMDAATLQRLFEPFFTTKQPGAGTGLGLTATRAIVARARGVIDVASKVGEGTSVSIRLPLAQGGAAREVVK